MDGITKFDLESQVILRNIAKQLENINDNLESIYDILESGDAKIQIDNMPTDFTVEQG